MDSCDLGIIWYIKKTSEISENVSNVKLQRFSRLFPFKPQMNSRFSIRTSRFLSLQRKLLIAGHSTFWPRMPRPLPNAIAIRSSASTQAKSVAINRTKGRCQLSDYPDSQMTRWTGDRHGLGHGHRDWQWVRWLSGSCTSYVSRTKASVSFNVRRMAWHERNADASFADQLLGHVGRHCWTWLDSALRGGGRGQRNAKS